MSVTLRGERVRATARRVEEPEAVERGPRAFVSRFPSNAKPYGIALGRGKLPDEGDIARAARDGGTVMVLIEAREG